MNRSIPRFILNNTRSGTSRKFKSIKRKQLRAVKKALGEYQLGCYYSPAYEFIDDISAQIEQAIKAQSIKNWGN